VVCLLEKVPEFVQLVQQVIITKTQTPFCVEIGLLLKPITKLFLVSTGQRKHAHFITLIKHKIQYNSKRRRNRGEEAI